MKRTLTLVLQGLGTVLPLGITLYALYWLAATLEKLTRSILLLILPDAVYFPGLGMLAGVGLLFVGVAAAQQGLLLFGHDLADDLRLVEGLFLLHDSVHLLQDGLADVFGQCG